MKPGILKRIKRSIRNAFAAYPYSEEEAKRVLTVLLNVRNTVRNMDKGMGGIQIYGICDHAAFEAAKLGITLPRLYTLMHLWPGHSGDEILPVPSYTGETPMRAFGQHCRGNGLWGRDIKGLTLSDYQRGRRALLAWMIRYLEGQAKSQGWYNPTVIYK